MTINAETPRLQPGRFEEPERNTVSNTHTVPRPAGIDNEVRAWDLPENWWNKVAITATCWLWTGAKNGNGYASVRSGNGGTALAHRMSYEMFVGPIPEDLTIDHLCGIHRCINPAHLEPVTIAVNNRRRWDKVVKCPRGHELTADNVKTHTRKNGHTSQDCKRCAADASKRYRDRAKAVSA